MEKQAYLLLTAHLPAAASPFSSGMLRSRIPEASQLRLAGSHTMGGDAI